MVYGFDISSQTISQVIILGVNSNPKKVIINDIQSSHYSFDSKLKKLTIFSINGIVLLQKNTIVWK